MNVKTQRKLYNTIGCSGAALGLALLALTKCDAVLAVASLCMVMAFLAFNVPGCFVSLRNYWGQMALPVLFNLYTLIRSSLCAVGHHRPGAQPHRIPPGGPQHRLQHHGLPRSHRQRGHRRWKRESV